MTVPIPCPSCGTPGSGRFCAECGAVLRDAVCGVCRSQLSPGAKFCHRCGASVGAVTLLAAVSPAAPGPSASAPRTAPAQTNFLPWAFVGFAVIALVVILIAQAGGGASGEVVPTSAAGGAANTAGAAAPDISRMSPRERADRLFERIMRLATAGKQDSVVFFAPMALTVYESLGHLDPDLRYDYGRIAEVSGNLDIAAAQADSILQESPRHLLGLILAARVADSRGDNGRRDALEQQLLAAQTSELAKPLDEYTRHRDEISAAIAAARSRRR